jgi:hypothetical protein
VTHLTADPLPHLTPAGAASVARDPIAARILTILAIIWGIIVIVVGVRVLHKPESHSLFPLFYETGKLWRAGDNVYAKAATFRYSPLLAAVYAGLSYLPLKLSQFVWMAANLFVLFAGLFLWARDGLPVRWTPTRRAVLLVLATPFMIGNISNLQANPMLLGAMLLAIVWTRERKFALAVAAIILATALKVYPLGLGLLLGLKYPKQFSWRLLIGIAVLVLLPFVMQHPSYVAQSYRDWNYILRHDQRVDLGIDAMYRDVGLIWYELVGPVNPAIYRVVQLSAVILVGLATLRLRRTRLTDAAQLHCILFLFILWILLFGPSTESATFMLAAPVAAWLLLESLHHRDAFRRGTAFIGYTLLFIGSFMAWVPYSKKMKNVPFQPVSCFVLLAALGGAGKNLPRDDAPKSA